MASSSGVIVIVLLGALALGSSDESGCQATADGTPTEAEDQGPTGADDDFSFEPEPGAVTADEDDLFGTEQGDDLFDDDDPGDDDFSFEPESP